MRSPRRLFALCSPMTQVMASATLLLPQPLGPTMAVTPLSKASSDRSENDLKPWISRRSRRMAHHCGLRISDVGLDFGLVINPQSEIRNPKSEMQKSEWWLLGATRQIRPFWAHPRFPFEGNGPGAESGRQCNKAYL